MTPGQTHSTGKPVVVGSRGGSGSVGRGRIDALDTSDRHLLSFVAACGGEFTIGDTISWTALAEDEAPRRIAQLLEAKIIIEADRPGWFRLASVELREELVETLSATQSALVHAELGAAIEERYAQTLAHHADELAHHFAKSALLFPSHAAKAIHYTHVAGDRASQQRDWGEAAKKYEAGAHLIAEFGATCGHLDLIGFRTAAAQAWKRRGEWRNAWRQVMQALQSCREQRDGRRLAQTALVALEGIDAPPTMRTALAHEALEALGQNDPLLEARLFVQLAWFEQLPEAVEAVRLARQAIRGQTDSAAESAIEAALEERAIVASLGGGLVDEANGLAAQRLARGLRLRDPSLTADALFRLAYTAARAGDLARAKALAADSLTYSRREGVPTAEQWSLSILGAVALAQCRFEDFDELWADVAGTPGQQLLLARRNEMSGSPDVALERAATWSAPGADHPRVAWDLHGSTARLLWRLGRLPEAHAELSIWSRLRETNHHPLDRQDALGMVESALVRLGDVDLVTDAAAEAESWGAIRFISVPGVSLDRLRGELEQRLQRLDQAERLFVRAQRWAEQQGAHLEHALAIRGQAGVARERGLEQTYETLRNSARHVLRMHDLPEEFAAEINLPEVGEHLDGGERLTADLSPRELEVLRLVSAGLKNHQIAEDLGISHHTVSRHISNILAKTGQPNRAGAAVLLARQLLA